MFSRRSLLLTQLKHLRYWHLHAGCDICSRRRMLFLKRFEGSEVPLYDLVSRLFCARCGRPPTRLMMSSDPDPNAEFVTREMRKAIRILLRPVKVGK